MTTSPVKVLLVEDSPIALEILQRLLKSSPEVKVVGTANNGKEALRLIPKVQPNVICTDFYMKEMDGLELIQQVMAKHPLPILVISNSVQNEDSNNIFKFLQAGAIDIFPKPVTGLLSDYERIGKQLISKIRVLSGVTVFTRPLKKHPTTEIAISPGTKTNINSSIEIVTIGASTGGPQALHKILAQLPSNFPVPVICTQHICVGFLQGFVDWLSSECQLKVRIAKIGESPSPGTIYFAPDGNHLELDSRGKFVYSSAEVVDGHRPSITVIFKSVAKFYGKGTLGVLLTGMGRDGAVGMQAIANAGGTTIAQDEKTCVVFGMPKEAIALGAAQHVLPIQEIAPFLLNKIF